MNRLIERKGPKLGLITTAGVEDVHQIGRGSQWADGLTERAKRNTANVHKPEPLIPEERTVGVKERIDNFGSVIRPLDEDHAREQIRKLINRGARAIVVSLLWSFRNPEHEQRVREIARDEFKPAYLGNVPIFLSSEVQATKGEYERTNTTILDAYLSRLMQDHIGGIKERLKSYGYEGDIQMIHNTGGMAESYKTTAVETYNGGPVAGLVGSQEVADVFDHDKVVVTDMGGTSFDIGLVIQGGTESYDFEPIIDRWAVSTTMIESRSIGAGGGSIADINEKLGDRIEVGPESAGADPGPACYNRGGTKPTVTDADVLLGYIDPEKFYSGKQSLDPDKAEAAIEREIADPLGIDPIEAAKLIREITNGNMGSTIRKETLLRGFDPREFTVYSFGGAGPLHAASYSEYLDIDEVVISPHSPVFCAFGSSLMDAIHMYEQSNSVWLMTPQQEGGELSDGIGELNDIVDELKEEAKTDFRGEGYDVDDIEFTVEMDMRFGGQIHVARVVSPTLYIEDENDAQEVYDVFIEHYSNQFSEFSVTPNHGVMIEGIALKGRVSDEAVDLEESSLGTSDSSSAEIGTRDVYWPDQDGFTSNPVYSYPDLQPGMEIEGPALIDADYTTIAVPSNWNYEVDEYRNGKIKS
jgi:N-methylhydantoinase A/acetophenone carboxylase